MKGHQPRRRFGQNFLADPHYVERIVAAVDPKPGERIVEIGPGLAALTADLIARSGHIDAVEIDRDLAARLRQRFTPAQLTLHECDALDFDFGSLGERLRVVGNLPYNISTPLLFHLVRFEQQLRDITAMLQREVVERMTAEPGTAQYGRLTIMLQVHFAIERLFVVPPGAFRPPPKVDSAVVRLAPLGARKPQIADRALFARLVTGAFAQRRKTLRNALASLCDGSTLARAGIDPGVRGETLSVEQFVRIANHAAAGD